MSATPEDRESIKKGSSDDVVSSVSGSDDKRTKTDLVDEEVPAFRLSTWLFNRKAYALHDENDIATRRSVYDDPDLAQFYWPKKEYENIHRFDPKARWTYKEERVSFAPFCVYQIETNVAMLCRVLRERSTGKSCCGLRSASLP